MTSCAWIVVVMVGLILIGTYLLFGSCKKLVLDVIEERFEIEEIPVKEIDNIPIREIIDIIKEEFLDSQYRFNIASQPVTTVPKNMYRKYEPYIVDHIQTWNDLFDEDLLEVIRYEILFVKKTEEEFYLDAIVMMRYLERSLHLQIKLFGKRVGDDMVIQLVGFEPKKK